MDREKRRKYVRSKGNMIKFDNLYYLDFHYELTLNYFLKPHIDLVKRNLQLSRALQTVLREDPETNRVG